MRNKAEAPRVINSFDDLPDNCVINEVAQFFRQADETIRTWVKTGEFPNAFKAGRIFLIPKQDVLELAQRKYGKR